jgi:hypothetical protein
MERIQRSHFGHRDQLRAELARVDEPATLIDASIRAKRGRDTHIEVQERS